MNVCGVLVHVRPDRVADVALAMRTIPGSELHGQAADGRLIVTVEDTAATRAFDSLTSIHRLPGVVAASLVYHNFEPAEGEAGAVVKEV